MLLYNEKGDGHIKDIILKTEQLTKIYGKEENIVKALDGINLTVKRGEFVSIVGTSGSGKSTLLHMLGGLDKATSGKVFVDDNDIFTLGNDELTIFRRRKIGFVFQNYNLVPVLNVYENIVLDRKSTRLNSSHIQKPRLPSSACTKK